MINTIIILQQVHNNNDFDFLEKSMQDEKKTATKVI